MTTYAKGTSVPVIKSRAEIETTVARFGAKGFAFMSNEDGAVVAFVLPNSQGESIQVRISLALPNPSDRKFTHHSRGRRTAEAATKAWEEGCRERWRALALVIKAKLAAAECGISTIEDEFLADTMTATGETVGDLMRLPENRSAITQGTGLRLLPGG